MRRAPNGTHEAELSRAHERSPTLQAVEEGAELLKEDVQGVAGNGGA